MTEWIITSCVLIGIVLLVRLILKNKISLRLRYALWLIVLMRLLVPVNFFSSPISVMNVVPESAPVAEVQQTQITYTPEVEVSQSADNTPVSQVPVLPVNPMPVTPETPAVQEPVQMPEQQTAVQTPEKEFSYVLLLQIIWTAGIVVTASVFLFANIRFGLRLKRTRQAEYADCPLQVYRTAVMDTPCLFGVFRPAIYLTEEVGEAEERHHILLHELTHYRHLDHIWGILRCLCLTLHWYNPLVWVAAIYSRRDSELACDEAVIRQLGEENRTAYGRTLIRMTCEKQSAGSILTTATTMTGSKKTITQRIKLIAKHPKTAVYAIICLVLVAVIAVGCTFTGANSSEEETETTFTTPKELPFNADEQEFWFTTGASAMACRLMLNKDGSFTGNYHDTEHGMTGEDYPNGTRYQSSFWGSFEIVQQVNDYSVELKLFEVQTSQPADEISFEDGMRIITTIAHGVDGGSRFILYLPNATIAQIPEEGRTWLPLSAHTMKDNEQLGFYYLYNEHAETGFYAFFDREIDDGTVVGTDSRDMESTDSNLVRTYPCGRLIYLNDSLYSMVFPAWGRNKEKDEIPHKIGEIQHCDFNTIPSTEYASNYFSVGTDVYQLDNQDVIYLKYESDVAEVDALWLALYKTSLESLNSKPSLTVAELAIMLENIPPDGDRMDPLEGITQYRGNSFTSGFWSYCCELQDADYYLEQYAESLSLVRLSDMKYFDLYTEDLNSILKKGNQTSADNLTVSGLILNTGFNLYADYIDYSVRFSDLEQSYDFSVHNHLFVSDLNVLLNKELASAASTFDKDLQYINIGFDNIYNQSCSVTINEADQVKIHFSDAEYCYEANGVYRLAKRCLSEHTEKADKYYKVDNLGAPATYSVYGFDTSEEENRTSYYAFLTDDNFVYVWAQYGTGTMARRAKFYDPKYGKVSPVYYGPTDYYQNMVVSYGYDDEGIIDSGTVQVCDIFSGEVLFTVDEYKTPINRSMVNAVWLMHFNRDGTAILVNYYDENYDLQWDTIMLPTELRVNKKVGTAGKKIPEYDSGYLRDKPWENQETYYSGVPDDQTAKEIAQAVLDEKFPGYSLVSYLSADDMEGTFSLLRFESADKTKWVEVDIDMQTGWIPGIYVLDSADEVISVDKTPENLLTSPAVANGETAAKIAEAIRAGWVRQTNKYVPYLSVQSVVYDRISGYWVVTMFPTVNYSSETAYYIVLDSKDGRIINTWVEYY